MSPLNKGLPNFQLQFQFFFSVYYNFYFLLYFIASHSFIFLSRFINFSMVWVCKFCLPHNHTKPKPWWIHCASLIQSII